MIDKTSLQRELMDINGQILIVAGKLTEIKHKYGSILSKDHRVLLKSRRNHLVLQVKIIQRILGEM